MSRDLKIFTDLIEQEALDQINRLLDQPAFKDCKIRIMPDVHAGAGCVIGFTGNLGNKIIPNIIGVDIGCGVLTVPLGNVEIDFRKLDKVIREYVAYGLGGIQKEPLVSDDLVLDMYCYEHLAHRDYQHCAVGSLGGGNHFIEIDADDEGNKYLLIHSGSRNLGNQVAKIYQELAVKNCKENGLKAARASLIETLTYHGQTQYIEEQLKALNRDYAKRSPSIPNDLAYLEGEDAHKYIHDMINCQRFAWLNRMWIARLILENYFDDCTVRISTGGSVKIKQKGKYDIKTEWFDTVHNYLDTESNIIRKGAVAANLGQKLVIPINMRDGALICVGKGNEDWNCSAPHGAGRLMSRKAARDNLELSEYAQQMEGIYSTCINEHTIDESPMAYKPIESIVENIKDTVDIIKQIKPIYNFKAED